MDVNSFNLNDQQEIILFDGVCNLCNHAVIFIIDRDSKKRYKFASLQSNIGQQLLKRYQFSTKKLDSLVLIYKDKAFTKSTAALKIARNLDGLWPLASVFIILPPFLRNFFYDIIAKYRYKLFGKSESCRYPSDELRSRFIDI